MQRDHGGNIDMAIARWGGTDWIDLSTGINRRPWPVPPVPDVAWHALPTEADRAALVAVAAARFGADPAQVLPVAGASAAIQILPRLLASVRWAGARRDDGGQVDGCLAAVLARSYNEHAASLAAAGWQVRQVAEPEQMAGVDLAVLVNPNNPDGREWSPAALRALAGRVGHLIVDESFADARPDLSLAGDLPHNATLLRSFGKFWGLAGVRLGFVIGAPDLLARLAQAAGPWAVSGPALWIGTRAMADATWAEDCVGYHAEAALRLDRICTATGSAARWVALGGTHLFRLYETGNAAAAQDRLARARIWSRRFPFAPGWLRLGVPGSRTEWARLMAALASRPEHGNGGD